MGKSDQSRAFQGGGGRKASVGWERAQGRGRINRETREMGRKGGRLCPAILVFGRVGCRR